MRVEIEPKSLDEAGCRGPKRIGHGGQSAKAFVRTCLQKKEGAEFDGGELYACYQQWCIERQITPAASQHFTQTAKDEMEIILGIQHRHDLKNADGTAVRGWKHLALTNVVPEKVENASKVSDVSFQRRTRDLGTQPVEVPFLELHGTPFAHLLLDHLQVPDLRFERTAGNVARIEGKLTDAVFSKESSQSFLHTKRLENDLQPRSVTVMTLFSAESVGKIDLTGSDRMSQQKKHWDLRIL